MLEAWLLLPVLNRPGHALSPASGDRRVPTMVKRVTEYPSFEAMLDHEDTPRDRR